MSAHCKKKILRKQISKTQKGHTMTKEQKMFRAIGIAYEKDPRRRSEVEKRMTYAGICWAIPFEYKERFQELACRLNGDVNCFYCYYLAPIRDMGDWTRQDDFDRAAFCYLLSHMSDNEREELL